MCWEPHKDDAGATIDSEETNTPTLKRKSKTDATTAITLSFLPATSDLFRDLPPLPPKPPSHWDLRIATGEPTFPTHATPYKGPLSYNPYDLSWDRFTEQNKEGCYCYCGHDAQWDTPMFCCETCNLWVHQACVHAVSIPRYFIFTCKHCSQEKIDTFHPLNSPTIAALVTAFLNLIRVRVRTRTLVVRTFPRLWFSLVEIIHALGEDPVAEGSVLELLTKNPRVFLVSRSVLLSTLLCDTDSVHFALQHVPRSTNPQKHWLFRRALVSLGNGVVPGIPLAKRPSGGSLLFPRTSHVHSLSTAIQTKRIISEDPVEPLRNELHCDDPNTPNDPQTGPPRSFPLRNTLTKCNGTLVIFDRVSFFRDIQQHAIHEAVTKRRRTKATATKK